MTQTDDAALMIFQLSAAEYRATGSEQAFQRLVSAKPTGRAALVSEVAYEVARQEQFALPWVGQLVRALAFEERMTEAALYCDVWVERAPDDLDALTLRVVLGCRALDRPAAQKALDHLIALGAPEGLLWGLSTMMRLAFTNCDQTAEAARKMLDSQWRSSWTVLLAAEAAIRCRAPDLFIRLVREGADLSDGGPERWQYGTYLFREYLIALLRARAEKRSQ